MDSNTKLWIVLCHLSPFLGMPFLLPLIIYLAKRGEPGPVQAHAAEVLNFHISCIIYSIISAILILIIVGFFMLIAIALAVYICAIIAAIKASEGGFFHYPLTIHFIR